MAPIPIDLRFCAFILYFRASRRALAIARGLEGTVKAWEWITVVKAIFQEGATALWICSRFAHAERSVRVFSGLRGGAVTIEGVTDHCAGGNWLPAGLRA
jgi:hypothetical protein